MFLVVGLLKLAFKITISSFLKNAPLKISLIAYFNKSLTFDRYYNKYSLARVHSLTFNLLVFTCTHVLWIFQFDI